MPSETFYCPHCKRQLTKSAQAYIQGEILENKGYSISIGTDSSKRSENVICPGCGGSIDYMKMIKGEYDGRKNTSLGKGKGCAVFFTVLIIVSLLIYMYIEY